MTDEGGPVKRLKKVLLVTPAYHCGMVESAGVWMPLGLAYLAGSLRERGYEPVIYDAMSLFHDDAQIRGRIEVEQPDVVVTTAYTATLAAALRVLGAAREVAPRALTVIGGVHPTLAAEDALTPDADFVVRGEGEQALPELLACLEAGDDPTRVAGLTFVAADGREVSTPDRPLLTDLDALPIAWDLVDWPTYHYRTKPGSRLAITSWSRGCPRSCSFCSQRVLWRGTWRTRSVEAVVAEVRMLRERFGVDTLEVADELPTADRERWEAILDRLIAEDLGVELLVETRADDVVRDAAIIEKYRAAGALHVYVGVEAARQDRLDALRKEITVDEGRRAISLLNDAGIITETSFLFGQPGDTEESVDEAVEAAIAYDPDLAFFLAVTPWPHTEFHDQMAERIEERDYSRYNLINPIIRMDGMSRERLAGLLSQAFMRFYGAKMRRLGSLPPHKREYLTRVARLLMDESYLGGEVRATMSAAGGPVSGRPAGHHAGPPKRPDVSEHVHAA